METTLQPVSEAIKAQVKKILEQFGLDFIIEKHPMTAIAADGRRFDSDFFGLINSKTKEVIHAVKGGYTVSQNHEIVELVLRGMEGFGDVLKVTKAGIINGGRKIFIQLEVQAKTFIGNDTVTRYITIIDSNDGSTGLAVGIGDVTLSCLNQFVRFYKKADSRFRHTATIEQKLKTIPSLISSALAESEEQMELYKRMAETPIEAITVHEMVKAVLGYDKELTSLEIMSKKKKRSLDIMEEVYSAISLEMADKGMNLWGLHSGITKYTTHAKKHPKRENGEIESLMIGGAYQMNQKSLDFVKKKLDIVIE